MRQLTSLDAQFLALETPRQNGHVGGIAVLDPSTAPGGSLTLDDLIAMVIERLPLLPPLRWRVQEVPFGLDYPYWIDDPEFDLEYHVREVAVPTPGSDEQLAELVSRIFSRPLDRARPLWELYLIHGYRDGYVVMLSKIHHAVVDGLSGAEIMSVLLDVSADGRRLPETRMPPGDRSPGDLEMLGRGLLGIPRYPLRALRSLPTALPNIEEVRSLSGVPGATQVSRVARVLQRAAGRRPPIVPTNLVAPRTSFNGRISPHRRVVFGQLPLDEVKAVKNAAGVTVNDVVVSLCAGAVRRWLVEHHELSSAPLVAQIPVSVRSGDQLGTFGNRILLMGAALFTNEPDPLRRLRRTHEALRDMKERHRALPAQLLQDANHFIPPAVFASAARLTFSLSTGRRGRPPWNLVVSNVPGPQESLYCAGARLEANYPVSVITDGMGLNITVMSYRGHLDFGIVGDRDQMPDLWSIIGWLREELDELRSAGAALAGSAATP